MYVVQSMNSAKP
uniref:Uncharacterized protein n=1 Tax=Steinernema glaseri TaxID=37863 RepID=A0A1I8ACR1_9BILA